MRKTKSMAKAEKLCARLIVGRLDELTDDEKYDILIELEEFDIYLEEEDSSTHICKTLMNKASGKIPMTAYIHQFLDKTEKREAAREAIYAEKRVVENRKKNKEELITRGEKMDNCVGRSNLIFGKIVYHAVEKNYINRSGYITIQKNIYIELTRQDSLIIEIELLNNIGKKLYVRVSDYHDDYKKSIYVSSDLYNEIGEIPFKISVCSDLPDITFISFEFFGLEEDLEKILPSLQMDLASMLSGFEALTLGKDIKLNMDDGNSFVARVVSLQSYGEEIYAGKIPFGENDIPFEINASKY